MEMLKEIVEKAYLYYPKNKSFGSYDYHYSKELKSQLDKRAKALKNDESKEKLNKNLKSIFRHYQVMDWTDLQTYNCYEYRVLLHRDQEILDDDINLINSLGNERMDLFLFISVLENYFYFQLNKTYYNPNTNKWYFEIINTLPKFLQKEVDNLREFLSSDNFVELPYNIVKEKIIDVETELKFKGNASVFDCFFTDLITI